MSLLNLYAPEIPLPDNLRVFSVLNQEVTSANTMVVRADENLALSAFLEQPLLESLLPDTDIMTLQVSFQCRPRLGIVPTHGALKKNLQNQSVGAARLQYLNVTLCCAKEWHSVIGLSN